MRFVVLVVNNSGDPIPATLHDSFDAAKQAIRDYLFDPKNEPPSTPEERDRWSREIEGLSPDYVNGVRGSDAWKEWVYVSAIRE